MERVEGATIAGRYRLVRKLGSGGMGSVWLAHDTLLDSPCALKLADDEKLESGPKGDEIRLRFQREAKAAAQLRGAHVVDVFDHGERDGVLYIAMEYLEGEDLAGRLNRLGQLDPLTTYSVVAQVARALSRAHGMGIVHRDLKPENIFLVRGDEGDIAKVLDFGIAQHDAYALEDKATKTGSFLGTPFYVSPEQARGKPTDHRADLWSLGIITFECLTGRPPFRAEALGELMGLILYEPIPKLTERNPSLPAALEAWWRRAASRDRELRFQSAKEMVDALGRIVGATRLIAVPSIRPLHSLAPPGSGESHAPSDPPPPPFDFASLAAGSPRVLPVASPSDPELEVSIESLGDTDSPVSRTRSSAFPPPKRPIRRRHVFAFSIGGIALGVLATLALASGGDGSEAGPTRAEAVLLAPAPPAPAAPAITPVPAVVPEVTPALAPAPAESATGAKDTATPEDLTFEIVETPPEAREASQSEPEPKPAKEPARKSDATPTVKAPNPYKVPNPYRVPERGRPESKKGPARPALKRVGGDGADYGI